LISLFIDMARFDVLPVIRLSLISLFIDMARFDVLPVAKVVSDLVVL